MLKYNWKNDGILCHICHNPISHLESQYFLDPPCWDAETHTVAVARPTPQIDFLPRLHDVQPARGSWAGGTVVVLSGYGLQGHEVGELLEETVPVSEMVCSPKNSERFPPTVHVHDFLMSLVHFGTGTSARNCYQLF